MRKVTGAAAKALSFVYVYTYTPGDIQPPYEEKTMTNKANAAVRHGLGLVLEEVREYVRHSHGWASMLEEAWSVLPHAKVPPPSTKKLREELGWSEDVEEHFLAMRHALLPRPLYLTPAQRMCEYVDLLAKGMANHIFLRLYEAGDHVDRLGCFDDPCVSEPLQSHATMLNTALCPMQLQLGDFTITDQRGIMLNSMGLETVRHMLVMARHEKGKNPGASFSGQDREKMAQVFEVYDSYWRSVKIANERGRTMPDTAELRLM